MRVFRLARVLLLLLAAPLASASGQTPSSRLDEIVARGAVRVGLTGDYRPFSILDKRTGQYSGLDVDMANRLAEALGVKLEVVPTAWTNLMADLAAEKFDVGMGGITITLERQKTAFFSTPLMRTGKGPIARCDDREKFQSLSEIDRPGVRVIVNPGGTNERFDRAHLRAAEIVVFPDNTRIFDELAAGHADLMITDVVETRLQQKLHPELCAIHPEKPLDYAELAYLLPRDLALKLYVDQWVHLATESGAYGTLLRRWLE
jgi:cyclohexadienyl dehydratase